MATLQSLIPKGFHMLGKPQEEIGTVKNPAYDQIKNPNVPPTINQGTGSYIVTVQDDADPTRQGTIKISIDPNSPLLRGNGAIGDPQFVVRQTGVNDVPTDKGVPPKVVYSGDLGANGLDWNVAEALKVGPADKSKTVSPLDQWSRVDASGKPIAATDTATRAKWLVDPNDPTNKIELPDPDKGENGTLKEINGTVYLIKPDGSSTLATLPDGSPMKITKDKQPVNVPGVGLVVYDPTTDTTKVVAASPTEPLLQIRNGKTFRSDDQGKTWTDTGLPEQKGASSVWTDDQTREIRWYNDQGALVASAQKPADWTPKPQFQPGQPQTSTTLLKIPSINPQTGALEYTDNPNRITASQATSDLAKSLGVKVAAGEMSEEDAQKLITNAVNAMNAQTSALSGMGTAAGNALQSITQGAQVGAGLLQNRVTAATGALQNIMGQASGSNMIAAPAAGTAGKLVSGLQGWVTELGGGQGAYDAAANLVQRADPTNQLGGDAAGAYAALGQAFQKYRDLTGTAHPLEQAAASATQANQPGGMPAPGAQPVAAASIPGPFTGPPPSLPAGVGNAAPNSVVSGNYGTGYNTAQLAGPRWPNPQPLPPGTQVPYAFQSPAASTTTPTSSGGTININVH